MHGSKTATRATMSKSFRCGKNYYFYGQCQSFIQVFPYGGRTKARKSCHPEAGEARRGTSQSRISAHRHASKSPNRLCWSCASRACVIDELREVPRSRRHAFFGVSSRAAETARDLAVVR